MHVGSRIDRSISPFGIFWSAYNNNNNNDNDNDNDNNNNFLTGKLHSLGVIFREVLCIKYIIINLKKAGFK